MTAEEILFALKEMGTAQAVKIYTRHGVGPNQYGVSYGNLGKLKKKVKRDHNAALQLWDSGNHDARVFAMMIADPDATTESQLAAWVRDLDNYVITDAFASFAARTFAGQKLAEKWRKSSEEWISTAGWNVLAAQANHDDKTVDSTFEPIIDEIASSIHQAPNRTRYSMNNALIAIGSRNETLAALAIAAANRIGKVKVDHGETGCKTPDAAAYIQKTRKHRRG